MKEIIEKLINKALKNLQLESVSFNVEHPEDFQNGDYSSNVSLVLAKKAGKNPRELALNIKTAMESDSLPIEIKKIEVAGPGFINIYLSHGFFEQKIDQIIKEENSWGTNKILKGKKVMVEYTQPNPFKPFHIGHLMSNSIGESLSRIIEFSGANTIRANYQGDVGPHVAKAIYGLKKFGMPDSNLTISEQAEYIGGCYSKANSIYETDEEVKKEIDEINKKVYNKSDKDINKIYEWGRKVTLEAFEETYKILGTRFDKYFFESEMAEIGKKIVKENVGKVFDESDGAIVFKGEKFDNKLHTRVFINSQGLPTYEAKELGLTFKKFKNKFLCKPINLSIVTTAVEQADYMKVVQKAISLIKPEISNKMKHITHGMMRFASGKMSSRKGNVVTGESLLKDSMDVIYEKMKDREMSEEDKKNISAIVGVSALKYSILRSGMGSDIVYDFEKSISFEGDSGPYLQYTAVRANSILQKAPLFDFRNKNEIPKEITDLEKLLYQFEEVVVRAYLSLEPHHIATYLTQISSSFNTFYGNTQILIDTNNCAQYHIKLVKAYYQTMKNGLWLLGIKIPNKM